jgi:hypothetical protein
VKLTKGPEATFSSVNRRKGPALNLERPKKYADYWFSAGLKSMLFAKDTPLLLRAAATASLAVAALLVLVPCVVLFFAVSPEGSVHHLSLFQLPVTCWAAWALVSLWAALDSSRLWRVLGRPVDPLGHQGVWAMLLGALNIGASLLVVVSRTPR